MVKFYSSNFSYDYSFPAVTLAYFLRYPNPYSTHVISTDVLSREFDPVTQRLHTVRLHLKRSKLPSAVLKIIPRSLLGASASGTTQSYILERSTVDVREGWMHTESQNMDWTNVLSVIEEQTYKRVEPTLALPSSSSPNSTLPTDEKTDVNCVVTLHSHLGQKKWKRKQKSDDSSSSSTGEEDQPAKMGFFKSWSTASLQRSIEIIGIRRTERSIPKAEAGMKVVLERLRQGGLVAVLEGMRRDREIGLDGDGPLKRAFDSGRESSAADSLDD